MFRKVNSTMFPRYVAVAICLCTLLASYRRLEAASYTWNVAAGNWDAAGNWTPGGGPPTTGDTGEINSGQATINAPLTGTPNITVNNSGTTLVWNTVAGPATGGTITVQNNATLQYEGSTTNPTLVTLDSGARLGRFSNVFGIDTSRESITIASGATVYANAIRSYVPIEGSYSLQHTGTLSGSASSTLVVRPGAYAGNSWGGSYGAGQLRLAPTVANTFPGTVRVEGDSATQHGILNLGGTGALANATLQMNGFGSLVFAGATNPFGTGAASIGVTGTDRLWWEGAAGTTYTTAATMNLANGASLGRYTNVFGVDMIRENLSIASGATVYADAIRSYVPIEGTYRLELTGTLSGDATTNLVIKPNLFPGNSFTGSYSQGQLRLGTSANSFLGEVIVEGTSPTNHGLLSIAGTGALANATLTLNNYASLIFSGATNPFGTGAVTINVGGTDRLWWDAATTYTGSVATLSLADGASIGRYTNVFSVDTIRENLSIQSGATVYADAIRSYVPIEGAYRLELTGALTGDATTNLVIKPNLFPGNSFTGSYSQGQLRLGTSANSFLGEVIVEGTSPTNHGLLSIAGTGALANATLTLNNYASLIFSGATNPFGTGAVTINVGGTDRLWWDAATTYTGSVATLSLANGAALGKYTNYTSVDTIRENLAIQSGATAHVDAIRSYIPGEVGYGLVLAGALTGDATTTLSVHSNLFTGVNYAQGVLRIIPTAVGGNTGFAGTVAVSGTAAVEGSRGVVELGAVGAIGSGMLEVQAFGQAAVTFPGALNNATSATVLNNGILRFRNGGASTLANTMLAGTGLVRAEGTGSVITTNAALQALNLNNVVVSPGTSAGTLTIEATTLSLDAASRLVIELGGLGQDLLQVNGNLTLNNSVLQLETLDNQLASGTYVIVNFTGTLTGTFGTIENNMTGRFQVEGIEYGLNFIAIQIQQVPEPSTLTLLGLGAIGIAVHHRRRRRIA